LYRAKSEAAPLRPLAALAALAWLATIVAGRLIGLI
jgi:hypothetical protein